MRIGLAWQILRPFGRPIVWHNGGTGGYRSLIALDPENQRGVVVLSNQSTSADDIGLHYARTLRAWRERFIAALPRVRARGFDEPFVRTWLMYLAFSEAAFAERTLRDHQLLLVRA